MPEGEEGGERWVEEETEDAGKYACTSSYLERKEIARIAENGGQWRTTVSIREVTQRDEQKIGNRKYEVRNRRQTGAGLTGGAEPGRIALRR